MFVKPIVATLTAFASLSAIQPAASQEPATPHPWAEACERWDKWDKPGPAFKVHGDTYYVGTCGIAAILVTSDQGHVLIDSGTDPGADIVLANIRSLGFDPKDVKLLLNSHEHFDHVGGMANVQEITGAILVTSAVGRQVIQTGQDHPADPQFGMHEPMRPVKDIVEYSDQRGADLLTRFGMTAIPTPGHTPGAMSWAWRSCEGSVCQRIVYADSLSAVGRDDYFFRDRPDYVRAFLASLDRIAEQECDLLLTPHPSASNIHGMLNLQFERTPSACIRYANTQRARLSLRLAKEGETSSAETTRQ